MPISYELDRTTRRVRTTVIGSVTPDDILNHLQAACREEVLPYAELIDARGAAPPILSPADIWHAVNRVRATEFNRQALGPRAVVVNDLAMFGMTRMFVTLVSDFFPISVFRDPTEAEIWLVGQSGRPPDAD
jgi:hypothetical protein